MKLLLIPTFILSYFFISAFILSDAPFKSPASAFFLYTHMCQFKIVSLINYVLGVLLIILFLGAFSWLPVLLYVKFLPQSEKSASIKWLILIGAFIIIFAILAMVLTYQNVNSFQYININFALLPFISFIILSYTICVIIKMHNPIRKYFILLLGIAVVWVGFNIVNFLEQCSSKIARRQSIALFEEQQCSDIFRIYNQKEPIRIGVVNGFSYINATGPSKLFFLISTSLGIKEHYFSNCPHRFRIVSVFLDTLPDTIQLVGDSCLNKYYYNNYNSLINYLPFDVYYRKMNYKIPIDSVVLKYIREQDIRYILLMNR